MPIIDAVLVDLPEDSEKLKMVAHSPLRERDQEKKRAEEHKLLADELHVEMLCLQPELERYKKWYYGPRADRLQSAGDLAQLLPNFAEELDNKSVHPDDLPPHAEPQDRLRRVKRRKGRRNLANFENLPVTTHVYELGAPEWACPRRGVERKEIGTDENWQVKYLPGHFERIHHVRKKYACPGCESNGNNPRMKAPAKPETAIDKRPAGPGLPAYIVTSKFFDYMPLYRLEDIFQRQSFEISRAAQSVWCGDVPIWLSRCMN